MRALNRLLRTQPSWRADRGSRGSLLRPEGEAVERNVVVGRGAVRAVIDDRPGAIIEHRDLGNGRTPREGGPTHHAGGRGRLVAGWKVEDRPPLGRVAGAAD